MSCDYSLSSSWKGKSWKDWISKLNVENLIKEKDKKQHHRKRTESVRTLPRKDILLHGQYPKEEITELCSCERCGKVMMTQSYLTHFQSRHGPGHHQQQDTSKLSSDVKKKSKSSKSKKKNTIVPQITGLSEQNVVVDSSSNSSNKGKSLENTTLENVKKTSSSKPSSSSHSLKKRSKSRPDDHSTRNSDEKKSKDSGDLPSKNSVDYKSSSKDLDHINSRSHDHSTVSKDGSSEERSHSKSDRRNSFCCEKCGKVFDSQDLLLCHQKYKHSSSSTSKHSVLHNSKSSSNKKKSNSTSKSSSNSSSTNSKKVERTGTKPYTDLVSDLSSLINHKGKTWVDLSLVVNNHKTNSVKHKDGVRRRSGRGLPRMETKLFGDFPKVDSRMLSHCEKCPQVVLSQEIHSHQKYYHSLENCLSQTSPSMNSLSPNSNKKKSVHLKSRKKPLLSSSSAATPIVSSKSAPSSPPSPLQASNEHSPPVMPSVQSNKSSPLSSSTSASSSPTTPPSSPLRHKKIKKDNKYKISADSNAYYDPDKHLNASTKGVCLRSIKSSENTKMAAQPPQLHSKGVNNTAIVENNQRVSPPVQVVKPFLPQNQMQPSSQSVTLMPPPPTPTTTQSSSSSSSSSKHKKSKKSKKPKEPTENEPKDNKDDTENSDCKGPCLRPVRSNSVVRVQQKKVIANKKDVTKSVPAPKMPKEEIIVEPAPPVVKTTPGLSVPKLLDDDDDLPFNNICTTTSQQAPVVTSQITSAKVISTSTYVKIAPIDMALPSMPQLFAPTFTTSLSTSMTTTIPITLSNTLETTLPPPLSPTLSTMLPTVITPTFTSTAGMSMPTLQTVPANIQPSVPTILDPIVQISPELQQQFPATIDTTVIQPTLHPTITTIPSVQPIQTTLQTALQPNIQTFQAQNTILTTLQSPIQQTVQAGMQPIQLAIAPSAMSPGDAFIPAISPSQLVLLPMSPVSVFSPVQEKTDFAPKPSRPIQPDRHSQSKKSNLVSILRKNNENVTSTEKTVELINTSQMNQVNTYYHPQMHNKASGTNMVSILRKPLIAERPMSKSNSTHKAPIFIKTERNNNTDNKFVQFSGSVIRMTSQPFLNPEPIFLTVPVPNTNSSLYTPHPKPLTSGIINGGVLKRHGIAISPHRAGARVEFLRNEIQQATITRRPMGNQCSLLNTHHRPNILKQPRNHVRTTGIKRNAQEKIGNDSKQIRLAPDVNGYILHTDVSEAAEAPQPTNSVTFLNMK